MATPTFSLRHHHHHFHSPNPLDPPSSLSLASVHDSTPPPQFHHHPQNQHSLRAMRRIRDSFSGFSPKSPIPILLGFMIFVLLCNGASGFGSMGPISAAFGDGGFFCAIDAGGRQDVVCWGRNGSSAAASPPSSIGGVPEMAALSGGEGFLCGISSNTSRAYCWGPTGSAADLIPSVYRTTAYSHIAAGKSHVCAVRGSYFSDHDSGTVDCWDVAAVNASSRGGAASPEYEISTLVFKRVVAGDGFTCGGVREGGVACWGPNSSKLGLSVSNLSNLSDEFIALASGRSSVCGISGSSREIKCWGELNIDDGNDNGSVLDPPAGVRFVSLTAGAHHFCGIREDNHGIECWGRFNSSSIPKSSGFMAIASSDSTTCGIREDDLVLDCWFSDDEPGFDPPLELCSPGLCSPGPCNANEFSFNASILHEADLSNLCARKDLSICSPCGFTCSEGFFLSSECTENADRVCTSCSLCQNSSCWDTCKLPPSPIKHVRELHRLTLVIGCSAAGLALVLMCWLVVPRVIAIRRRDGVGKKKQFKPDLEPDVMNVDALSTLTSLGSAQVFRLSELKDATNGFKEFTELGRGSYGFVYKAVLSDGKQVAVKRANAATIIHSNNRDFEIELEVLCKIRHCNIVNLLGYCSEMGERLLVYEYMPRGTLHDHLHGGLSPLNWSLRIKICMQAAKGLEYLHNELDPPVVHRDVKSSNILLDSEWGARIADFGLLTSNDKDNLERDLKGDVFNFGIVLLEVLSGRKAYDRDYTPPSILEWALPLIRKGKAAAIIDRDVALPRNVEPLLRLADLAELAVRENPLERPSMLDLASGLEQIVKDGLIL